jgi:hypothetical protein
MDEAITEIQRSICSSTAVWDDAGPGDLSEFGGHVSTTNIVVNIPDPDHPGRNVDIVPGVIKAFYALWLKQNFEDPASEIRLEAAEYIDEHARPEDVIRMAALISCGYGVTTFAWSYARVVPVFVYFRDRKIPALVPISVPIGNETVSFSLVESTKYAFRSTAPKRYALVAKHKEVGQHVSTLCLFPPDVELKRQKKR